MSGDATVFERRVKGGEDLKKRSSHAVFPRWAQVSSRTFVHAVVPVGVRSELLDGLAAEQAGVGGLSPERENRAT